MGMSVQSGQLTQQRNTVFMYIRVFLALLICMMKYLLVS